MYPIHRFLCVTVPRPKGAISYNCKWVLRSKRIPNGTFGKYKSRLLIFGNQEKSYDENLYAPVVDFTTVRLLLSIAVQNNYFIGQLDFESAFLSSDID